MKKEVNPIDLNYTEFERIYNDCLPKESSKNFLKVILQQKSDGFPNDSKPIFFDKDKINEHKADIFYLYGQLASIHREQPFFFVINSIQKYDGTIWTDDQTSALLLLHLGMACGASSRMAPPQRSIYLSSDLLPTLSPKDPNFEEWYKEYKQKILKKSGGQEPADD